MRYATVCSGIEAPSAAWHQLGWQPAFFSEIEPFPSAVLQHHYPDVPNRGDMTKFKEWPDDPVRLICAGTPCQSFSVAGRRKGLDDPRGNLTLVFLAILERTRPQWVVWENVHGVLSADGGRAFGSFLGGLAQLGYGFAYRVLDAQYFGIPQRRRRVFVVGHLGDWRRAAAVLFERHCLQGHPAPSREAGQGLTPRVAGSLGGSSQSGGFRTTDLDNNGAYIPSVAPTLNGAGNRTGGDRPPGMQVDTVESLIVFGPSDQDVSHALSSRDGKGPCSNLAQGTLVAFAQNQRDEVREMEVAGALAGEPGMKQQTFAHVGMQVRRLTPRECERLQGFPDDYTLITVRGKPAADGPRYKALGNSMAVPVVRWIGERIQAVEEIA